MLLGSPNPILWRRFLHSILHLLLFLVVVIVVVVKDLYHASRCRRKQEIIVVGNQLDIHIVQPLPAQRRHHPSLRLGRIRPFRRFLGRGIDQHAGRQAVMVCVMNVAVAHGAAVTRAPAPTSRPGLPVPRTAPPRRVQRRRRRHDIQELQLLQPVGQQALADHLDVGLLEGPVSVEATQLQLGGSGLGVAGAAQSGGLAIAGLGRGRLVAAGPDALLALCNRQVHRRVPHVPPLALREHLAEDVHPLVELSLRRHVLGRALVFVRARNVHPDPDVHLVGCVVVQVRRRVVPRQVQVHVVEPRREWCRCRG